MQSFSSSNFTHRSQNEREKLKKNEKEGEKRGSNRLMLDQTFTGITRTSMKLFTDETYRHW